MSYWVPWLVTFAVSIGVVLVGLYLRRVEKRKAAAAKRVVYTKPEESAVAALHPSWEQYPSQPPQPSLGSLVELASLQGQKGKPN